MLKITRIILAVLSLLAVTALFVDVTGFAMHHWAWMAKIQLIPALLSLNLVVLAALIALALVFGRIYCSIICPLGVYQDVVNRISTACRPRRKRKLGKFHSKPAANMMRNTFFIVFALLIAGHLISLPIYIASLIEPYSAFGRMATWLVKPGVVEINNALADSGNTAFVHASMPHLSIPALAVAAITFIIVTAMAWTSGRDYCNKICPVGWLLGKLSKFALLKINIDTDRCNGCGSCARHCKASCIDPKTHTIDYTRCVTCFDCIGECTQHAISYSPVRKSQEAAPRKTTDKSRRAFLSGGAVVVASLAAEAIDKTTDGGLAPIKSKRPSASSIRIVPAGAKGAKSLSERCTACQLCITNCPNSVLRPSEALDSLMQPVMAFNEGWCRPECTVCGDVCPVGAIEPVDLAVKSSTKIGTATVDLDRCISAAYGQTCGNCARRCPAEAITMIPVSENGGNLRPMVDENACIGCGSCEYHCPVGRAGNIPGETAAIHVEGIDIHHLI
ncbi:MAG: 4Fe-4S dicluster domain-containing protein [Bacteroidales bacterium]|nr:4Fe-4S dicluster domain-containing protein [Bacteroidales bacterium]